MILLSVYVAFRVDLSVLTLRVYVLQLIKYFMQMLHLTTTF